MGKERIVQVISLSPFPPDEVLMISQPSEPEKRPKIPVLSLSG